MINIGLLGAGRIGAIHARTVASLPQAAITAVCDPKNSFEIPGARRVSLEDIMADPRIDAVIIATPTDLHADQIHKAARAGKAIFCEKPIDLDAKRVRACLEVVKETGVKLMVGFNRRFDPSFARVQAAIAAGAIGDVELVQITSRDPSPPPLDYIRHSGGLFHDMMIHDFDMARVLLGEDITEVKATGSVLIDPAIGAVGDIDTATATLKTARGKIAVITNSRRATYGYDQRLEVHGSKGMIAADNHRATSVCLANGSGYTTDPLMDSFPHRYADSYRNEGIRFCDVVAGKDVAYPSGPDALKALHLAEAAVTSMKS